MKKPNIFFAWGFVLLVSVNTYGLHTANCESTTYLCCEKRLHTGTTWGWVLDTGLYSHSWDPCKKALSHEEKQAGASSKPAGYCTKTSEFTPPPSDPRHCTF